MSAEVDGGKFGHGFASSYLASGADRIGLINFGNTFARVISNALVAGTISEITGGKFSNGATSAAFRVAFNDLAANKTNAKNRQVSVDPNFEGPLSSNDTAKINEINQSLSDLRNALNMKGDSDKINKLNDLKLLYSPDGRLMTVPDSAAEASIGGNYINFGPNISHFINPSSYGNYHGAKYRGGRAAMAWLITHELGHTMDNNSYNQMFSSNRKREEFANDFVVPILPYFNRIGLDTSDIKIMGY